jgi:Transglutaminase-like superfamily
VTIAGCWTRVFVDDERCLVYGPRLGRLYLFQAQQALERNLQRLLGLRVLDLRDDLTDPAQRIVHNLANLKAIPVLAPPASLPAVYRMLHRSRRIVPFRAMLSIVARAGSRHVNAPPLSVSDIGRLVHAVERAAGLADCYPRALLTAYLCLRSGRPCELAVGALAPTRKMHAWCSTDGQLPYEASPEHYMYRPLLVMTLAP